MLEENDSNTQQATVTTDDGTLPPLPHLKIKPLALAMYSSVNFDQLEEDGIHYHRYMAVEVIHKPFMTKDGYTNFLVKDKVSDSNRVLRVELVRQAEGFGLFCF